METQWRFGVFEDEGSPPSPQNYGSRTLTVSCMLGYLPPEDQKTPDLIVFPYWERLVPLAKFRDDGHDFFTRLFSDLPVSVNTQTLDTHALVESVLSLAATTSAPLIASVAAATVMPSDDIERQRLIARAAGMEYSRPYLALCMDRKRTKRLRIIHCIGTSAVLVMLSYCFYSYYCFKINRFRSM